MIYDPKTILGLVAALVGFIGYVPYYRDVLRGLTKPHPFSWIGFSLMLGITFFAQEATGAGPGSWVTAISALGVLGTCKSAQRKGAGGSAHQSRRVRHDAHDARFPA